MTRLLELTGQTFGELTVLQRASSGSKWMCLCSCGKETSVVSAKLKSGHTKSCGHLAAKGVHPTHGDSESREYRIWTFIIQRCYNPKRAQYYRYGGRGIKMCDRWRNDYAAFLADMGRAPFDGAQIDRIDNDKDYSPENCRWVSQAENNANRSTAHYVEHDGRRLSLSAWARVMRVPVRLLSVRASRGWTDSEIVTGTRNKHVKQPGNKDEAGHSAVGK